MEAVREILAKRSILVPNTYQIGFESSQKQFFEQNVRRTRGF